MKPLTTEDQVRGFPLSFKKAVADEKWLLEPRDKNMACLNALDLAVGDVPRIIQTLTISDYSSGPLPDDKGRPDVWWEFGPVYLGRTLYVKIAVSKGYARICSLHSAQWPMDYPLRRG